MDKIHINFLIFVVLIASLFITACNKADVSSNQGDIMAQAAQSIAKSATAISIESMSDRIIKQQNDYLLYDIRSSENFVNGHIKNAQSVAIAELLSAEGISKLANGRDIFIYSRYSDQAAQLAVLLRTQGLPAYYLTGGYSAWSGQMVNVSSDAGVKDAQELAKQQAVACWFEGDYVAAAGLTVKTEKAGGGYVPSLEPVTPAVIEEDSLGLGLGLGLGPEDDMMPMHSPSSAGGLNIGEGC